MDDIELPPLPEPDSVYEMWGQNMDAWGKHKTQAYARAAITAYRAAREMPSAQPTEAAKLDRPAQVGGVVFREGISERLVIEAAKRHYDYEGRERAKTREQRVLDEQNRRAMWDLIHGAPAAAAPAQPQQEELQGQFEALDIENHRMRRAVAKLMARLTVWLDDDQFNEADSIMHPEFEPLPKPDAAPAATQPATDADEAEEQARIGALVYRGNTVSYMYSKAKNYGDTVLQLWGMLAEAGYKVDGENHVRDMLQRCIDRAATQPEGQEAEDAARYRWLRARALFDEDSAIFVAMRHVDAAGKFSHNALLMDDSLDEAIDAARAVQAVNATPTGDTP